MAQVTIYLDEETARRLDEAAKAAGLSRSRWIADLVRSRTADRWPESVARLAGAWSDLPDAEALREDEGEDVPREPW